MARKFLASDDTPRNARPMTFEKDRGISDWDRSGPQTQAVERQRAQDAEFAAYPEKKIRNGKV